MADNVKWFKIMNDMFDDEKIEYIESLPDGSNIALIWVKILCLASKSNTDGSLMITKEIPYTPSILATKFKKDEKFINYSLQVMEKLGMIYLEDNIINVSNWGKYQSVDELAKIREQTKLRVAKCRERKRLCNVTSNDTVTLKCNDNALISNIYNSNNLDINNIYNKLLLYCKEDCEILYNRYINKVNNNNLNGIREIWNMLEEIVSRYTDERLRELFRKANKTFWVQPKYQSIDFAYMLNHLHDLEELEEMQETKKEKHNAFDMLYDMLEKENDKK